MNNPMNLKMNNTEWKGDVFFEEKEDELDMSVHGVIGEDFWAESVTSGTIAERLESFSGESINVSINSVGGSAADGIAIYQMLRRHNAKVNVYVDGVAASAASVIAMAGDTVVMGSSSMMMIHNPWTAAVGDSGDFRKAADTLDKWRDAGVLAYERKTGLDKEDIVDMMNSTTWLLGQEAADLGFADLVDDDEEQDGLMIDASFKGILDSYGNLPDSIKFRTEHTPPQDTDEAEESEEVNDEQAEQSAEQSVDAVEESVEESAEVEEQAAECAEGEAAVTVTELKLYMKEFGEKQGASWFIEGISFDDCQKMHAAELQKQVKNSQQEIEELKEKLQHAVNAAGEELPVSTVITEDSKEEKQSGFASKIRFNVQSMN